MKKIALITLSLTFCQLVFAQLEWRVGITTALDYTITPTFPTYVSWGYGAQLGPRSGVKLDVGVSSRLSFALGVERFARRRNYDCVYFPSNNRPAQPAWHPLINDPVYGCEFKSYTRLDFIEIPMVARYRFPVWKQYSAVVEVGSAYQIVTRRINTLTDLQSGEVTIEENKENHILSKLAPRFSIGGCKRITDNLMLYLTCLYRGNSLDFEYNSIGLGLGLNYRIFK